MDRIPSITPVEKTSSGGCFYRLNDQPLTLKERIRKFAVVLFKTVIFPFCLLYDSIRSTWREVIWNRREIFFEAEEQLRQEKETKKLQEQMQKERDETIASLSILVEQALAVQKTARA